MPREWGNAVMSHRNMLINMVNHVAIPAPDDVDDYLGDDVDTPQLDKFYVHEDSNVGY